MGVYSIGDGVPIRWDGGKGADDLQDNVLGQMLHAIDIIQGTVEEGNELRDATILLACRTLREDRDTVEATIAQRHAQLVDMIEVE